MRSKTTHAVVLSILLTVSMASLAQEEAPGAASALSFDQRVEAQEAIERVFWSKRIWPKDNPGPKPKFEDVMSHEEIVAKVQSAIERSSALESRTGHSIADEDLDAEIARMIVNSHDPETLKALMDGLHNDPVLLRECLAKPALVDLQEAKDQCLPEAEGGRRRFGCRAEVPRRASSVLPILGRPLLRLESSQGAGTRSSGRAPR